MDGIQDIEVGQNGDDFRLWLATEGRRQGEVRLAAQAAALTAMETRATAILQWSVAIGSASVAVMIQGVVARPPFAAALCCLFLASALCIAALWPKNWHPPGYSFEALQDFGVQSELEVTEGTAYGYATAIAANDRTATRFARLLKVAWLCFAVAPLAALCAWVIS